MKIGAVIAAAGMSSRMHRFKPLLKVGDISMVERVIQNFQSAGIEDIVIVTGNNADQIEDKVDDMGVFLLKNNNYEHTQMLDSVKIGLDFLKDKCSKILFTPVDIPLFKIDTVKKIIQLEADIVIPLYEEKSGHPIMFDQKVIREILLYKGEGGLCGAIQGSVYRKELIAVDDRGILFDADTPEDYKKILKLADDKALKSELRVRLIKERGQYG